MGEDSSQATQNPSVMKLEEKCDYGNCRFPGQKPDERIQMLIRKHWIIDVKVFFIFLVLGIVPFLGMVVFAALAFDIFMEWVGPTGMLIFWVYMLFTMLITYIKWLNEELDIIIVTNERVISHDQVDLFHRQISETNLAQVQDVKGIEKGLFGNIFHYGSLKIQTAAHNIVFEIENVDHPYESARIVLDLRDKALQDQTVTPVVL